MDVNVWGPPFWFILHTVTMNYPDAPSYVEKRHHFDFFNSLQYILPCGMCREHYKKHFKDHPIDSYLDNKKSLVEWCVLMHNEVNKVTNKPEIEPSELIKDYLTIYNTNEDASVKQKKASEYIFTKIKNTTEKDTSLSSDTCQLKYVFVLICLLFGVGGGYYYYLQHKR